MGNWTLNHDLISESFLMDYFRSVESMSLDYGHYHESRLARLTVDGESSNEGMSCYFILVDDNCPLRSTLNATL